MTPRGPHTVGRRVSGVNAERKRSISAGRIHSARGSKISPWGPHERRCLLWGAAGAHIAELVKTMLEKKASGIELAQMERGRGA